MTKHTKTSTINTHAATPALNHFIRLAQKGRMLASSTYERKSRVLALALLDTVPGLDGQALDGLIEFTKLIKGHYQAMRDMIGEP